MAARDEAVQQENSFIVTIKCEVTSSTGQFEELITKEFIAALRNQRGYLGAMLWKSPTSQITGLENDESSVAMHYYQLSLKFVDQQSQLDWVGTEVHTTLWAKVRALASSVTADKYQTIALDDDWN